MRELKPYSPYQFALFRVVFGIYLVAHFAYLLPYGAEVFSRQGMLPDPSVNFTYGYFPNVLLLIDNPLGVNLFIALLVILSIGFTLGIARRVISLLLWYGWACLYHRNNFIEDPTMFFTGWLLLACSVIPSGEPLTIMGKKTDSISWEMPVIIFGGAWVIMALSYSISGIHKLIWSPSWHSGMVLQYVMESPYARSWFLKGLFLSLPVFLMQLNTWIVLAMEVFFAPLCPSPVILSEGTYDHALI